MTPAEADRAMEAMDADWRDRPAPPLASEDRIELLEIVARLAARWRVGLVTALVIFVVGGALIASLHSMYVAEATLLPQGGDATPTNNLTAFFTGARSTPGFLPLLQSRTLEDDVVKRTGLMKTLQLTSEGAARGELLQMAKISTGVDGVVHILVRSRDGQQAVNIANAYVDALRGMQEHIAETQSELQLHVYQQQLQKEREALTAAEQDLEQAQIGSGVVQAETQTQTGLSAIAATRAEIDRLEVQLAAVLQGSTEQNPEVRRLRSQIGQLRAQERSQQSGGSSVGAGAAAPAGRLPAVNLMIARKQREVRYHEQLVSSLASHFDAIRLNEASLNDNFDVLDRPVMPEAPTWPPRTNFFLLLGAFSLFAGLLAMLVAIVADRVLQSPVQRAWLHEIARGVRKGPHGGGEPAR